MGTPPYECVTGSAVQTGRRGRRPLRKGQQEVRCAASGGVRAPRPTHGSRVRCMEILRIATPACGLVRNDRGLGARTVFPPLQGGVGGVPPSCKHFPASGGRGGCPSRASFAYAMFAARDGQPPARYSPPHGLPFTASRPPHLPPFRQGGGRASGGHACPPNIKCGWCWLGLLSPAGADARPAGGARSRGLLWLPPRQIQAERGGGTAGRTASLFSIPTARPKKSPLRGLERRPYFALLGIEV